MIKNIDPNTIKFYQYSTGNISAEEFEQWVYNTPELENHLGKDQYMDLISFSFKSRDLGTYINSLIKKCFNRTEFEKWRTVELLTNIKNEKIEIVLGSRKMRELYLEQEEEIIKRPLLSIELAIGYESELDNCPIESEYHIWSDEALKKQLEPVTWYKERMLKLVNRELNIILISSEDLENAIDNDTSENKYKKAGQSLLMAITDWPTMNLVEPVDLINELKKEIGLELIMEKIKQHQTKLNLATDAWKAESLSSVLEVYNLDNTKVLDELVVEIAKHYKMGLQE
jgi:hypothetical protein